MTSWLAGRLRDAVIAGPRAEHSRVTATSVCTLLRRPRPCRSLLQRLLFLPFVSVEIISTVC